MDDQLPLQTSNYAKLNEYLTNKQYSNEELYDYLLSCRNQLAFSHHFFEQQMVRWSADMIKNLEFPSKSNSQGEVAQEDQYDILSRTQQHIFAEVIALTSQIASLQAELASSNAESVQASKNVADIYDHFDDRLCGKAQREQDLTIQASIIGEVKAQTQDLLNKIQLTNLLNEDLDGLTLQNQIRNSQIKQQIRQVSSQLQKSVPNNTKIELQTEISALKDRISQYKNKKGTANGGDSQGCQEELLRCLDERNILQQQLLHQQLQKREFIELLKHFKVNFKKVKEHNKKLKQQLMKRGLSMPSVPKKQIKVIP